MKLKHMLRRTAGLMCAAMLAMTMTACGGGKEQKPTEVKYQSMEEAIAANVPEGATEEQQISVRDGATVVLYSREDDDKPFTLQAYSAGEDGWHLLSSRTAQTSKQDVVQELFPANDSLMAFCVSPDAEDIEQQAYEFHIEGANGWVFGYNPIQAMP